MRKLRISLIVLLYSTSVFAQQTNILTRLTEIVSKFNNEKLAPGAVITLSENGGIIFNKATGLSDLEHGINNTTSTVFEAGSVSKQFTATAVLLLIRDKKLSLNDEVRKFIPELPNYDKPILVKHLLVHTSGIKDWGSVFRIAGWSRGNKVYEQIDALNLICKQKTLNFTPGDQYSYSNSNYTLLSYIVERISGMSLPEFTKNYIFKPIGMNDTRWRENFRSIVHNRAIGYAKSGRSYLQDMPFENTYGHAALLTTTTDLIKWLNYWGIDGFGKQMSVLRATAGTLNSGQRILYAYGAVRLNKVNQPTEIYHSGITAGYRGWLAYYPEKKIALACLGNGLTLPSTQLTKLLDGKPKPVFQRGTQSLNTDATIKLKGIYRMIGGSDIFRIIQKNGKLFVDKGAEILGYKKDTLSTGSHYLIPSTNYDSFTSLNQNGITQYQKVSSASVDVQALKKFEGNYYSQECEANYQFEVKQGEFFLIRNYREYIKLQPVFQNAFIAKGILLEFQNDGKLVVSVERANRIIFEKKSS